MTINLPGAHSALINEPSQDNVYFSPLSRRCPKNIASIGLLSLQGLFTLVWFTCVVDINKSLCLSCVVPQSPHHQNRTS